MASRSSDQNEYDYPYTPRHSRTASPVNHGPRNFQDALETHIWHLNALTLEKSRDGPDDPSLRTINKLIENQAKVKEMISGVDVKVIKVLHKADETRKYIPSYTIPSHQVKQVETPKPDKSTKGEDGGDESDEEEDPIFTAMWKAYLNKAPERAEFISLNAATAARREMCIRKYKADWKARERRRPVRTKLSIELARHRETRARNERLEKIRENEDKIHEAALLLRKKLKDEEQSRSLKRTFLMAASGKEALMDVDTEQARKGIEQITEIEINLMQTRVTEALTTIGW